MGLRQIPVFHPTCTVFHLLLWRIQTVLKSDPICDSDPESTVGQYKQSNVENRLVLNAVKTLFSV